MAADSTRRPMPEEPADHPSATASSSGLANNYNMAARGAAMLGGVMGTVAGMPLGQSQTFAQAGAAAGRRIVSNIGQAHQAIAQADQNGTSKPAAIGQAAGALLGGATGAHVAGTAMAMGSRLLHGAPQAPAKLRKLTGARRAWCEPKQPAVKPVGNSGASGCNRRRGGSGSAAAAGKYVGFRSRPISSGKHGKFCFAKTRYRPKQPAGRQADGFGGYHRF